MNERAGKRPCSFVDITGSGNLLIRPQYRKNKGESIVKRVILILAVFLVSMLLLSSCTNDESSPIPDDGTRVTHVSDTAVFLQAANDLQENCEQIGGCTCFMDGIQTTCSLVFACLDAGFCELVRE